MNAVLKDLDPVVTEYAYELRAGNRAPGTIRNYRHTIGIFADWCDVQPDGPEAVAEVTKDHVVRFIAARGETEAPETVLTRFRHLRAFFRWCEGEEIVERSPMTRLKEPISPIQPVPILTPAMLRAVFDTCRGRDFKDRRDLAMMAFLADTGCRVGELVGLEVDDVDFESSTAEVLGKGRRRRVVAFGPKTGKLLLAYLRARAQHKDADSPKLWLGARGPIREAHVWTVVKRHGEEAGIEGLHPHMFRHTFAHAFRLQGGQEGELASLGGWKSPAMLARYGQSAAVERAVEAHRRIDPLGDIL